MSVSLYQTTIVPMRHLLRNISTWLTKAEQHADSKSLPHTDFTEARLVADMLPLRNQIYIACNVAKFVAVRVADHPNQVFEDDQKTFAELQGRVADTLKFLEGVKPEAFESPDILTKEVVTPQIKFSNPVDYITQYALPNFYFHTVTVYDILRHKGVEIGKMDYLPAATTGKQ